MSRRLAVSASYPRLVGAALSSLNRRLGPLARNSAYFCAMYAGAEISQQTINRQFHKRKTALATADGGGDIGGGAKYDLESAKRCVTNSRDVLLTSYLSHCRRKNAANAYHLRNNIMVLVAYLFFYYFLGMPSSAGPFTARSSTTGTGGSTQSSRGERPPPSPPRPWWTSSCWARPAWPRSTWAWRSWRPRRRRRRPPTGPRSAGTSSCPPSSSTAPSGCPYR